MKEIYLLIILFGVMIGVAFLLGWYNGVLQW